MLALTATATELIKKDAISSPNMEGCEFISVFPNCPNIFCEVKHQTNIKTDLGHLLADLQALTKLQIEP